MQGRCRLAAAALRGKFGGFVWVNLDDKSANVTRRLGAAAFSCLRKSLELSHSKCSIITKRL